jgi:hypothetical protein
MSTALGRKRFQRRNYNFILRLLPGTKAATLRTAYRTREILSRIGKDYRVAAPSWRERANAAGGLPNLGFGGTAVTAFVTSFFGAAAASALFVILVFGPHAYFVEHLRVKDWKHGVLSTGETLSTPKSMLLGLMSFVLWVALIFLTEWLAGLHTQILKHRSPWVSNLCRLLGGGALLFFAFILYNYVGFPPVHPIPISSLIAGVVLIWQGVKRILRPQPASGDA